MAYNNNNAHYSANSNTPPDSIDAKTAHRDEEHAITMPDVQPQYIDPEIERRVIKKTDWHVVSLVFWLFLLSFLDRSNIGNAETAGMATDLHFDENGRGPHTYDWLLTEEQNGNWGYQVDGVSPLAI